MSIIICGLLVPRITNPSNLYFSLIDKHRMLQETQQPRIILVGGSNLSFGIKSKLIQDSLNINVINTSVHAGLGLKFISEDIVRFIKSGDIIILAPEYEHFFGSTLYGSEPMVNTIIAIPDTYRFLNFHNWKEILGIMPEAAVKNLMKFVLSEWNRLNGIKKIGIYDRDSFNEYGDVVSHYGLKPEKFSPPLGMKSEFNYVTIETISLLKQKIEEKGGLLLFTYPCIMRNSLITMIEETERINYEILNLGIPIIGTPQRYSFEDNFYFNSQYHLTEQGVDIRTKHLIEDLKENTTFMGFLKLENK